MRISDWSSDVCSSDLEALHHGVFEDLQKGLLIGIRGAAPVAADDVAADRRHVEALIEQLTEVLLLFLAADRGVAQPRGGLFLQHGQDVGGLDGIDCRCRGPQPDGAENAKWSKDSYRATVPHGAIAR